MNAIHIRLAALADAENLAEVQVSSWQTTYKGIVPDEILDDFKVATRTERWREILEQESGKTVVAEQEGKIVGFASCGRSRQDNEFSGELYAIYLIKEAQRRGIGGLLLRASVEILVHDGIDSMIVWVLRDNPSKNFYKQNGGSLVRSELLPLGRHSRQGESCLLQGEGYGWYNLPEFLKNWDKTEDS